jgi:hypothetical protein
MKALQFCNQTALFTTTNLICQKISLPVIIISLNIHDIGSLTCHMSCGTFRSPMQGNTSEGEAC